MLVLARLVVLRDESLARYVMARTVLQARGNRFRYRAAGRTVMSILVSLKARGLVVHPSVVNCAAETDSDNDEGWYYSLRESQSMNLKGRMWESGSRQFGRGRYC